MIAKSLEYVEATGKRIPLGNGGYIGRAPDRREGGALDDSIPF
jgi:hypothetical protein